MISLKELHFCQNTRDVPPPFTSTRGNKNSVVRLTVGNGSKLLEQLDMGAWLDGGGDVWLAARRVQQGVIVEQAAQVGSFHGGENVFGHVVVKVLRVTLQGLKQAEGFAPGFNILGGKAGNGRERREMERPLTFKLLLVTL